MNRAGHREIVFAAGVLAVMAAAGCGGGATTISPPPPAPPRPSPLMITTQNPLPRAVINQQYSVQLQASGGSPPYSWTVLLPFITGMTLATNGLLSGTPTQQGTYGSNVTVSDSKGLSSTAFLSLDIIAPLSFVSVPALPDENIGLPVSQPIFVTGGVQPYTYTLVQGSSMPPGLTFSNGTIQGTPSAPGSYKFTIQVVDSFTPPFMITQLFTLNITNNLVLPHTTLPDAVQNVAYREQIQPAGGTPPYHYVLGPNSSPPPGLTLDSSTGIFSGTPTTSSQFIDFMLVTITDSSPTPMSINPLVGITVQPPLAFQVASLPDSARGFSYQGSVFVIGGRAPFTIQIISGALPDGLSPTISGTEFFVTGVPTKDGLFKFTGKVTDSYETPNVATMDFQIRISDPMMLSGPTQAQILYNQSYSTSFPATGGFPPYTWKISFVPPGFTFDPTTGLLSGTPIGNRSTSTTSIVTVQDSSSPPLAAILPSFELNVWGQLIIMSSSLPAIATGSPAYLQPLAIGGAGPYQWSVTSGSPPPGMAFNQPGGSDAFILSGTPETAGTYSFTLFLSDGNSGALHQTVSQQLSLTVKDRGQMGRNDTIATATPLSNIGLFASISPYTDPSTPGPDIDVYSASAAPGSAVQVTVLPDNELVPSSGGPSSLQPVIEIVDGNGNRYQTCGLNAPNAGTPFNLACVNGLPGSPLQQSNYYFQVPGTGAAPITFYIRVSDARGDARPDFVYSFMLTGVN